MKTINAQEFYDKFGYLPFESNSVLGIREVVEVAYSGCLDLELGTKLVVDRELTKAELLDVVKWIGYKGGTGRLRAHVYGCIAE